jgi:hypothetical protein
VYVIYRKKSRADTSREIRAFNTKNQASIIEGNGKNA